MERELAGAAMVLMPSRYHEFAPYSALEAMAAGVPVVGLESRRPAGADRRGALRAAERRARARRADARPCGRTRPGGRATARRCSSARAGTTPRSATRSGCSTSTSASARRGTDERTPARSAGWSARSAGAAGAAPARGGRSTRARAAASTRAPARCGPRGSRRRRRRAHITGTSSRSRMRAIHFSCFGAPIPTQRTSGRASLIWSTSASSSSPVIGAEGRRVAAHDVDAGQAPAQVQRELRERALVAAAVQPDAVAALGAALAEAEHQLGPVDASLQARARAGSPPTRPACRRAARASRRGTRASSRRRRARW